MRTFAAQNLQIMSGALKEVRLRIASVQSTQQITKAMKMVSAAKLRRAQDAIVQMRPYAVKLQEMLSNIIGSSGDIAGALSAVRPVEKVLIIAVGSDRGLCGAFNTNVVKTVRTLMTTTYAAQAAKGNVHVLPIGKKVFEGCGRLKYHTIDKYWNMLGQLSFEKVKEVAEFARASYISKDYDRVEIVYNQFKNAATQVLINEQHLPIAKPAGNAKANNEFIFEPSKEVLINELMPKILNTQLYKAVLDSNASDHGARMTAMDKATDNAESMLKSLKISYNRARQAAITTELTEIVSGAAALKG
ncbi:MAG: synthase subunit gamma [Bacteroidota bacterium]